MPDYVDRFRMLVEHAVPRLLAMPASAHGHRPAPGKWSPREVIGHLIDSASNNHQRFVRAQFQDDLVFPGYDQDRWVAAQAYQEAPWTELVGLWRSFNLHLARVMELTPDTERRRARHPHNLHQIAFTPVAESQPATLDDFMADYVDHLDHHLRQLGVLPFASPEEAATIGTSKYAWVMASMSDGHNAVVVVNGGTDTTIYPLIVYLRRDGPGWLEGGSTNWGDGNGWSATGQAADGRQTGMWHQTGSLLLPDGVDAVRVSHEGQLKEVLVQHGLYLAVFFDRPAGSPEPRLEAVRQNGEWREVDDGVLTLP